jgi:hypothetical protein
MGFLFLPIQQPNESDKIVRELYFCGHPISITVQALEVCWSLLLLVLVVYLLPIHSFGSRNRYKSGCKWWSSQMILQRLLSLLDLQTTELS